MAWFHLASWFWDLVGGSVVVIGVYMLTHRVLTVRRTKQAWKKHRAR